MFADFIEPGLSLGIGVNFGRLRRDDRGHPCCLRLQEDKAEFERLFMSFTDSTSRAESSVARLKASATDTAQSLQDRVTQAQALRDDLAFMVDRADELANRLEGAIREARPELPVRPTAAQAETSGEKVNAEAAKSEPSSQEEPGQRKTKSDLLKALEGMR